MKSSGGMKRSEGMKRSGGMKKWSGMPKAIGMELVKSSMELVEVYQRPFPGEHMIEGILISIGSALLAIGGIALIVVSGGTATPGVTLAGVGLMSTGISGVLF